MEETFPLFGDEIVGAKCEPREGENSSILKIVSGITCYQLSKEKTLETGVAAADDHPARIPEQGAGTTS